MLNPHEEIKQYADDYVHDLLSQSDREKIQAHCSTCQTCQQEIDIAKQRLSHFLAVGDEAPSRSLIKHAVWNAQRERLSMSSFEKACWVGLAVAASLLVGLSMFWMSASPSPYNLMVYGQEELSSNSRGSIRVALYDRLQDTPVAGKEIVVDLIDKPNRKKIQLASFITDAHGTGAPQFELPDWPTGDYELVVAAATGHATETITRTIQLRRDAQLMMSSDKPVYQPGQTIQVRSLVRRRLDSKPISGQQITYRVIDPKGNLIAKQVAVTSKYGISSFRCPLATQLILGTYRIECDLDETSSALTVEVKKYVLPKFKVDVEFSKSFFGFDEKISGTIAAAYFFGKPVAGGLAEVELRMNRSGASQTIRTQVLLDDSGAGSFEFPVQQSFDLDQFSQKNIELDVTCTVTDTAKQRQQVSRQCLVTREPLRVELVPESSRLAYGLTNRIFVFTRYADGKPAPARVSISNGVGELETNQYGVASFDYLPPAKEDLKTDDDRFPSVRLVASATDSNGLKVNQTFELSSDASDDGFVIRTQKAVYNGGETLVLDCWGGGSEPILIDVIKGHQTLSTHTVTMKDGQGQLQLDLSPELNGVLQVCAYRFDRNAFPVKKFQTIFVRSANDLNVTTTLDKQTYRPGESARLKFKITNQSGQPTPGAIGVSIVDQAVFSVERGEFGLGQTLSELERELLEPVYQIYPWSPSFNRRGDTAGTLLEMAAFSRISNRENQQNEKLNEIVDKFLDGEREILGVLQRPDIKEMMESVWLPEGFWDEVAGGNSVHSMQVETAYWALRKHQQSRRQREDILQFLWGTLGFFAFVAVGVGLLRRSNTKIIEVTMILIIVVVLIGMLLPPVQQAREAARRTELMNDLRQIGLAVENYDAANPSFSKTPGSPSPPRDRKWFPETLLWKPELITNDAGEVTLDVELADSITSWKILASAGSLAGDLGASETSLRVFQPFFVDVNLPVALTRGDEVSIPIIVYNYLPVKQTVSLEIKDAAWFEMLPSDGPSLESLELGPNQTRSVYLPIRATKLGKHPLQIAAVGQSGVADAIERVIEIEPEGQLVERVINGTIDGAVEQQFAIPKPAVEGSGNAIVKIYPSGFSQIVEGLDSVFRRPYGCFEQTSSTTYPSVLALDYLRQTKKNLPEVEAKALQYIHLGYQRLLTFEVDGGGFDWFGRPPANVTLTAYGLMEFKDMAAVRDVDPDLIRRTEKWLLSKRNKDGSWSGNARWQPRLGTGNDASLATTAYVAWSIFDEQSDPLQMAPTRKYLLSHAPETIRSPYTLALVCNALLATQSVEQAGPYVDQLVACVNRSADRKQAWWSQNANRQTMFYGAGKSGDIETTALAALVLIGANREPLLTGGALRWLIEQKDPSGAWHSTQATVLSLKALLAGTRSNLGQPVDRQVTASLDGEVIKQLTIPTDQADVMQQIVLPNLAGGTEHTLKLKTDPRSSVGFQLAIRHHVVESVADSEPIDIALEFDRAELSVSEQLKIDVRLASNLHVAAPMVMATLPIPPGFAIEPESLDDLVSRRIIAKYELAPRSAILYFRRIERGAKIDFQYRLRAIMPVKTISQPATCYLYYDPQTTGQSDTQKLTVLRSQNAL